MVRRFVDTRCDIITYSLVSIVMLVSTADATAPPQNNYTVENADTICIVMSTGMQLTIPYSVQSKNYSADVSVDHNATSTGLCSNTNNDEILSIHFYKSWTLSFVFSDYKGSSTNTSYFYIIQINLTYTMDDKHFPKLLDTTTKMVNVLTLLGNDTLSAKINGSYQCKSNVSLSLNNSIIIRFFNLKYRAFGNDHSTWFSDNDITECLTEESLIPESDIKVAVGVGIALGVMMIVTVLLYVVVSKAMGT